MEGSCTNQIPFAEKCSPNSLSTCSGTQVLCKNCTETSRLWFREKEMPDQGSVYRGARSFYSLVSSHPRTFSI